MSDAKENQGRLAEDLKGGREAGAFKDSLVLTRDEKKFAVAREIARSKEEAFRYQGPDSVEKLLARVTFGFYPVECVNCFSQQREFLDKTQAIS